MKLRYLFLHNYGNHQLEAYLRKMVEKGYVLDHCRGNFLYFRELNMTDTKFLVLFLECTTRDIIHDDKLNETIDTMLDFGWQLLAIGDLENLIPLRRRLYFFSKDPDASVRQARKLNLFEPQELARRSRKNAFRRCLLWLLLTPPALYSMGTDFSAYPVLFSMIGCGLIAALIGSFTIWLLQHKKYTRLKAGKKLDKSRINHSVSRQRFYESVLLLGLITLFVGLILLLLR